MNRTSEKEYKKYIRKGRRLHAMYQLHTKISNLRKKPQGKVLTIPTSYGNVRTLTYGFEESDVRPLFIGLHGGGFVLGNPEMDEVINNEFIRDGKFKILSIEYAKAPAKPYPAALEQIYEVILYIIKESRRYGIDTGCIGIGGHSAGGNLSLAVCLKALQTGEITFNCLVLDYPPLDIATDPDNKPQPKGCIPPDIAKVFNACYVGEKDPKDMLISPFFASDEIVKRLPPSIFILPGMDSLYEEGKALYERMVKLGCDTRSFEYPSQKHGFTLYGSEEARDAIEKMKTFIEAYITKKYI